MKDISIATGIIEKDGKFLIARRTEPERLKGLWEFPGGTIEENETEFETLIREIKEETNLDIEPIVIDHKLTHDYGDRKITINFITTNIIGNNEIILSEHDQFAWIDKDNWNDYEWTELTKVYAKIIFE